MCIHGNEDGKCEECYEEFKSTGIRPVALMTFGEAEKLGKTADPVAESIVERTRKEVCSTFMQRSIERHRNE